MQHNVTKLSILLVSKETADVHPASPKLDGRQIRCFTLTHPISVVIEFLGFFVTYF